MVKHENPFGPGLLRFLRDIRDNNDPAWFRSNKQRYESELREPALEFIRTMAPHVKRVSPYFTALDKKVGGSLMRIHRDVRFSRDKSPYKTNLGIQFRHEQGRDVHAPGLYFHVDPDEVFLGAGMWHPDSPSLAAVRAAIDRDPRGWKRVRDGKRFREFWALDGDSLKRAPRGYDEDHPMIEDLKRKDHIAVCHMRKKDVSGPDLVQTVAERFRAASGYLKWQAGALEIRF